MVDILSPIGELPLPANEAQARELAPLVDDPDAVRAVWAETVQDGDGRITARMVREHVTARHPDAHTRKPMAARGLVVSAVTVVRNADISGSAWQDRAKTDGSNMANLPYKVCVSYV